MHVRKALRRAHLASLDAAAPGHPRHDVVLARKAAWHDDHRAARVPHVRMQSMGDQSLRITPGCHLGKTDHRPKPKLPVQLPPQPRRTAQADQAVKSAKPAKPAKPVKSAKVTKATEATKPVKAAKVVKPLKTVKPVKAKVAASASAPAPAPVKAPKPAKAAKAKPAAAATQAEAPKVKLVRDSFTMPELEYTQLSALKRRALALAHHVKKSELLRAGVATLAAMNDETLLAALQAVPPLKTGRPKSA